MSTPRRSWRGPRVARVAALLLSASVLLPLPAQGASDDLLRVTAPTDATVVAGPARSMGFWLGPVDDEALRIVAIRDSGLTLDAAGAPVIRTLDDARRLRRSLVRVHAAAERPLVRDFRAAAAAMGITDLTALHTAPLVLATVTPAQAAALAALPSVFSVEEGGTPGLAMATAAPTIGAPAAFASGFRGDGVRVAVVEYARIDFTRPTLPSVPRQKLRIAPASGGGLTCVAGDPLHPDVSISHMTRVGAIIAGRASTAPRGVAPGATLVQVSIDMPAYDNLETAARVAKAIECAITQGDADVINLSLSEPRRQSYVRTYVDHLVRTYGVFTAVASGNAVYGTCPDGEPVSPATAWNVLTVGGTDDRGTRRPGDDRLWSENGVNAVCTTDPRGQVGDHDRRLKPEISAVARNIGVAGYPLSSGTSYATPMVSGAAATLIGHAPALANQPHVVKAILIASSRLHRTPVTPGGRISTDREGAGTLRVDWANTIVSGQKGALDDAGGYGERTVQSLPATGLCREGQDVTFSIPAHAGRSMRVAITWMSHADKPTLSGDSTDRRKADIDLVVRAPGGSVVHGAGSSRTGLDASNVEWLDFTAGSTGTYLATLKVARWDCDLVSEPVGFAWVAFPD